MVSSFFRKLFELAVQSIGSRPPALHRVVAKYGDLLCVFILFRAKPSVRVRVLNTATFPCAYFFFKRFFPQENKIRKSAYHTPAN